MTTITQARFREWRKSHGELHEARGVRKGIQQERRRNVAMVRRLAAIKFGAQTAERLDQVGVAIMECDSGAELLARCSKAGQ